MWYCILCLWIYQNLFNFFLFLCNQVSYTFITNVAPTNILVYTPLKIYIFLEARYLEED